VETGRNGSPPQEQLLVSLSTASEPEFSNALFFSFSCTTSLTGRPKLQHD
jgi:hypothetical protein